MFPESLVSMGTNVYQLVWNGYQYRQHPASHHHFEPCGLWNSLKIQSPHSPLQTSTLSPNVHKLNSLSLRHDANMLTLPSSCMAFMPVWQDNQFTIAELDVIRKFVPSAVFKQIEDGTLTYVNEMRLLG